MSKYIGTYQCGHEGEINVCGPMKDRQRKVDWVFDHDCPACEKAAREAAHAKANQEAAAKANEMHLAVLAGSEKQIAWAETIRMEAIESVRKPLATLDQNKEGRYVNRLTGEVTPVKVKDVMALVLEGVNSKTEAAWWIDNRATLASLKGNKQLGYYFDLVSEARAKAAN